LPTYKTNPFGETVKVSKTWKKVGHIPVDSAQVVIIDPCYINKDNIERMYNHASDVTLSKTLGETFPNLEGTLNLGFATSTGSGDGYYPVYAQFEGKRVSAIKITFT
jgi:hypothetical protein